MYSDDKGLNSFCGLINYWSFDGNANDVVGKADMIYGANATFTNDRINVNRSAVDLNFGYYTIPSGNYFNGNIWTVTFWIFSKSIGKWPRILDFFDGSNNIIINFALNTSSKICSTICNSTNKWEICTNMFLNVSIWNHVSVVSNLNEMSIYLNGINKTYTSNNAINYNRIITGSNFLGKSNSIGYDIMNPIIDDLKIFDIAMNSSQIIQNMNLNFKLV